MTRKRQASSIINVNEESIDMLNIEDTEKDLEVDAENDSFMNVEMSTDNIEDIVSANKMDDHTEFSDVYMMD